VAETPAFTHGEEPQLDLIYEFDFLFDVFNITTPSVIFSHGPSLIEGPWFGKLPYHTPIKGGNYPLRCWPSERLETRGASTSVFWTATPRWLSCLQTTHQWDLGQASLPVALIGFNYWQDSYSLQAPCFSYRVVDLLYSLLSQMYQAQMILVDHLYI